MWQVLAPPERAKAVHGQVPYKINILIQILNKRHRNNLHSMLFCQVMDRLNLLLHTAGVTLHSGDSGPCLVTVVNSSRIQADITRDTRVLTGDQEGPAW